jgi:hypothetical protein
MAAPTNQVQRVADGVRDPPQPVVAVDDVVGDRDDVMAAAPEEVDHIAQRQSAVGVGRVNVKVAEQHFLFRADCPRVTRSFGGALPEAGERTT